MYDPNQALDIFNSSLVARVGDYHANKVVSFSSPHAALHYFMSAAKSAQSKYDHNIKEAGKIQVGDLSMNILPPSDIISESIYQIRSWILQHYNYGRSQRELSALRNDPEYLVREITMTYLSDWRRYSEYRAKDWSLANLGGYSRYYRSYFMGFSFNYITVASSGSAGSKDLANKMEEVCFLFWFGNNTLYVCDFPETIVFEDGELGAPGRPAIEWKDGGQIWAINSIIGSKKDLIRKNTIDVIANEPSVEMRRVRILRYGSSKFLEDVKATVQSEDGFGKIWSIPGDTLRGFDILDVINSTPNPDGSSKHYYLMVKAKAYRTPKDAVAASFGDANRSISKFVYNPVVET